MGSPTIWLSLRNAAARAKAATDSFIQWLASRAATKSGASGIGIDTPSVDYGPSAKFETHNLTMPLNLYHIENAANLTTLPATGFTIVVAPIKLAGGSGGPTRVFALLR